ncbi:transglutaminaseTgpA domain-containing protein [Bacillus sp. DTU_2020_1000418_1_SI_GHA_SEK_038]|uniref:transglutaminase TgpA family protein n=1 Tax=Bacillus sp. DTU_2020_1000418_1_SI_GHA_SEK_038 TaxID=3077585 RepID=UPI0028E29F9F|nr:transglutaminaseTgpA domain-containing protein [Bacillus sp. DTU_2020_1000418_1_SI_GHA_SEK_038]WNS76004.1 transglutaminaseTgpA domain-containing protein [Bacillus sp. DTU_2020_1000418_1_SI_GHA_SEK_038]
MKSRKVQKDLASFLLYTFGFLLLWEWLRPLEQLTDTSNIWVFLLFSIVSLLLAYLGTHFLISGFIKWILIFYVLHFLYFEGSFFRLDWIPVFMGDFYKSLLLLVEKDTSSLSNFFKSFLFFILLWLMTYLIQYWLIRRRQIFIFFFMTLIYITVLDTFTPYEAEVAIVRAVITGFVIMGMLTLYRLMDKEVIHRRAELSRKWLTPLMVMIVISVAFGLAAPKADPIWPDPVPFIKSYAKGSGDESSGVQRIGYGLDDSQLGGPFLGDNQVVFRAEVESRQYWKVETKDVYTGKGWITSGPREEVTPFRMEEVVPVSSFINHEGVNKVEEISFINASMEYKHIVYPLGIKRIDTPFHPDSSFEIENFTEKIHTLLSGVPRTIYNYSVIYDVPKYSVTALMNASSEINSTQNNAFIDRYTQLPDELPQRVRELALTITEGKSTWFEQARALESYFKKSGFVYDQKNVAVPGADDDYVDQFLFETKTGYCDNYSTSMVVMARSLGIPARWVKGYTEGEYKGLAENSRRIFEVTNNNAHSWVEVYFPNIGWVPFEPTQGFSNNVQFNFDQPSQSNSQPEDTQPKPEEREKPEIEKESPEKSASSFSFTKLTQSVKGFFAKAWKWLLGSVICLALLLLIIYRLRGRWLPYYLALRFKWTKKDENFPKAYMLLLRELQRYGLHRKEGQTLREYAQYVDRFYSTSEMSKLTSRYEKLIYRGEVAKGSWEDTKELWENLIKKTIA